MSAAQIQKEEGNKLFSSCLYDEALACYTKALDLCSTRDQTDLAVYFKNRAACYLKLEDYEAAIKDASKALEIIPNDAKALFRRCSALEALGRTEAAYTDARLVLHIDPKNTAIQPVLRRITARIQDNAKKQTSTGSQVSQMFALAFSSEIDSEKRKQACNNLIVLARQESGSELIYKEQGVPKLVKLLDENQREIVLAAVRVLACLCNNNKKRSRAIMKEMGPTKWFLLICLPSETLTTAVAHLLQSIISSLAELDQLRRDREKYNENKSKDGQAGLGPYPQLQLDDESTQEIDGLFHSLIKLIDGGKISACGRDSAIELIIKNVTNKDGVNWVKKFLATDAINRLLNVGGTVENDSDPMALKITDSTKMNVSVLLSRVYDELTSDKARDNFRDQCNQYFSEQFGDTSVDSHVEAIVAVSTLLQGPYDVGNSVLGTQGVLEIMLAMAGSENALFQRVAVEAIVHSASKKDKCSGMIKQAVPILKSLYHSKNENVKVRALVGLCKLGSFGGTDASAKSFAEGSTTKLARACRKFLTNTNKDLDLRRWACEGLAYLTLDGDVKEELVSDNDALGSLMDMARPCDQTLVYPAATVFVNLTNSYDTKEVEPELVQIAKYAKQHVPEEHPKDKKEYVEERISKLVKTGLVNALVMLSKTESLMCKELLSRVFLAICTYEQHRGLVVQQGGAKVLIPLALEGNDIGKCVAAQALAKIGITLNPEVAFPGQRCLEVVRPLIHLLGLEMPALMNFESLMALTNLASTNDSIRKRILKEKGFAQIEHYMFEEHEMLRRAATECMCNLVNCEDTLEYYHGTNDRVKMLVLYCTGGDDEEPDEKLAIAACGALAILTYDKEVCEKTISVKSWEEIFCVILASNNIDIQLRAAHTVMNLVESDKDIATKVINSKVLDVLILVSQYKEKKYDKVKECVQKALSKAQGLDLIKPNPS